MVKAIRGCTYVPYGFAIVAGYDAGVNSPFVVGSISSPSRLVMGTGGLRTMGDLRAALVASGSTVATVALRRVDPSADGSIYDLLQELKFSLLPNTAGCYTTAEAVKIAELSREAFGTNALKLEIIGDNLTLLPDPIETVTAAVMPLGSPIGSGLGIRNPHAVALICERLTVPVLLDAGIGTASDAALAMELGCDGVLAASAINRALNPELMAAAIRDGVRAGYAAHRAGRIAMRTTAEASSPVLGMPDLHN